MKPTTAQERADILHEVREAFHGAGTEWARHWTSLEDEGILHGADVRLLHHDDGTTVVELDGAAVMRVRFEVTAEPVEFEDARNEPTGFVLRRTWSTVLPGWFVRDPKGRWLEIGGTSFEDSTGKQMVSLIIGGQAAAFPRDPDGEVLARRGTLAPRALDEAMETMGRYFETRIIEDEGPMQS